MWWLAAEISIRTGARCPQGTFGSRNCARRVRGASPAWWGALRRPGWVGCGLFSAVQQGVGLTRSRRSRGLRHLSTDGDGPGTETDDTRAQMDDTRAQMDDTLISGVRWFCVVSSVCAHVSSIRIREIAVCRQMARHSRKASGITRYWEDRYVGVSRRIGERGGGCGARTVALPGNVAVERWSAAQFLLLCIVFLRGLWAGSRNVGGVNSGCPSVVMRTFQSL